MEPLAWREQVDKSLALNPRFGPQKPMEILRFFEIMVGVMFSHLPAGVMTRASGVEGGAPWDLRCSTCGRMAALENERGSPDTLCHFNPLLTPFLWVMNYIVTKLEAWRSPAVAVTATEGSIFEAEWGFL